MYSKTFKILAAISLFGPIVFTRSRELSKQQFIKPNPTIGNPPIITRLEKSITVLHIDEKTLEGWALNRKDAISFTIWSGAHSNTPMSINHHSLINRQSLIKLQNDELFDKKAMQNAISDANHRFTLFLNRPDVQCIPKDKLSLYSKVKTSKQLLFIIDRGKTIRASGNVFMFPTLTPHAAMQILKSRCDKTLWAQVQYGADEKVVLIPLKNIPKAHFYHRATDGLNALIQKPIQPVEVKLPTRIDRIFRTVFNNARRKDMIVSRCTLMTLNTELLAWLNEALSSICNKNCRNVRLS